MNLDIYIDQQVSLVLLHLVPQSCGGFVILIFYGYVQLPAKIRQLHVFSIFLGSAGRHFSTVLRLSILCLFDKGHQFILKFIIIMRTAERAFLRETFQCHAAFRTGVFGLGRRRCFFSNLRLRTEQCTEQFIERNLCLNRQPLLLGTWVSLTVTCPITIVNNSNPMVRSLSGERWVCPANVGTFEAPTVAT